MKFTFVGCSFTVGEGLVLEKSDVNNYVNIVANHHSADVKNLAVGGNSNYNIFISALNEILFNNPTKIFVQWSAINRVWLHPKPNIKLALMHIIESDFIYRDIFYSKKELQHLSDSWHFLNHDFNSILQLVNYCNILEEVSKNKTQVIFINGILLWTKELATEKNDKKFGEILSEYTKELLDFEINSDEELTTLFAQLNTAVLSLNKKLWVNQFNSMYRSMVDVGLDKVHPGPKSHRVYADTIIKYLEGNNE